MSFQIKYIIKVGDWLLFCRLTSNFASLKIRNVRPLSPLSCFAWYHSHAFSTSRLKHKMLSRVSDCKVYSKFSIFESSRRGKAKFSHFHAVRDTFEIFLLRKKRLGHLCVMNSDQSQLVAPSLGLQKSRHVAVKMCLLPFLSLTMRAWSLRLLF